MPRYREVSEILAAEIASGLHPVGARFPTEFELCDRFQVSRHTVREALRMLEEDGLLTRQAGAGTRVQARAPAALYTQTIESLSELLAYATEVQFEKTHEGFVTIRESLADHLGRAPGERWLRLAGIRRQKDSPPLCWTEIFVAEPFAGIRDRKEDAELPYYERIQRAFGLTISEVEQRISAIAMPADIAKSLGAEPGAPALLVRRSYYTGDGKPFEVSLSLYPGDRYAYTQSLNREPPTRKGR